MPRPMRTLTPNASPRHSVGALLREWRLRIGWSQFALGQCVGASASWISRVEKAERPAPVALLSRCNQVLGTGGLLVRYNSLVGHESADDTASVHVIKQVTTPLIKKPDVDQRLGHDGATFSSPEAGLSAAAKEAAVSATRLVKLAEGLSGAVQRARLGGLNDQEIAYHLSVFGAPIAVRRALAADKNGATMQFLVASVVAAWS